MLINQLIVAAAAAVAAAAVVEVYLYMSRIQEI